MADKLTAQIFAERGRFGWQITDKDGNRVAVDPPRWRTEEEARANLALRHPDVPVDEA